MFVSNLNQRMSQRFLVLVLLPHVRRNIRENRRLHFVLFQARTPAGQRHSGAPGWGRRRRRQPGRQGRALQQTSLLPGLTSCCSVPGALQALKKATYKAAAFYKGLVLPLCASGTCTLREAFIVTSVIRRTSIPVLHSAAALLRIAGARRARSCCPRHLQALVQTRALVLTVRAAPPPALAPPPAELPYSGTNSFFIRVLLDKKYALPYRVIDALVDHFTRFKSEERVLPVVWHQALLCFVQRCAACGARCRCWAGAPEDDKTGPNSLTLLVPDPMLIHQKHLSGLRAAPTTPSQAAHLPGPRRRCACSAAQPAPSPAPPPRAGTRARSGARTRTRCAT